MTPPQTLSEQLQYMYGLERFGMKLGLEVMTQLMAALDNPHQAFPSIHITGTNGKGSTASFLARMLQAAGYTIGLYTSPHLYRFNERIRVNGEPIADASLGELIEQVRTATTEHDSQAKHSSRSGPHYQADSSSGVLKSRTEGQTVSNSAPWPSGAGVTFFEFTTALAFLHFARRKVDIAVIEAGMGGLLDATNVVTPLVSIITNIGLEHVPHIGKNEREIALNKAGIIKLGVPVVTAEPKREMVALLAAVAAERRAPFIEVQKKFAVEPVHQSLTGQTFKTGGRDAGRFKIRLLGQHQIINACTALAAVDQLDPSRFTIGRDHAKHGLAAATWEGRLDIVSRAPFILVDGAHNNHGAESLSAYLDSALLPAPGVLILAKKKDKDLQLMDKKIVPRFAHVIVTEGNYEAAPAAELAAELTPHHDHIEAIPDLRQALSRGKELLEPEAMMLIAGSLYMVGDALAILRRRRSAA